MSEDAEGLANYLYDDEYTTRELSPSDLSPCERELLVTRQKLETRTWLMRLATGLLVGSWTGFLIHVFTG